MLNVNSQHYKSNVYYIITSTFIYDIDNTPMSDKGKTKKVQTIQEDDMMETDSEKVTIRIPKRYLKSIDFLVRADDFPSRSEAIRAAIRDMVYHRMDMVPDKLRKMQDAEVAIANAEALERELIKK